MSLETRSRGAAASSEPLISGHYKALIVALYQHNLQRARRVERWAKIRAYDSLISQQWGVSEQPRAKLATYGWKRQLSPRGQSQVASN